MDEPGRQQQAPLHGAAHWGWNKVVEFLIEKGADINLADSRGMHGRSITPWVAAQPMAVGRCARRRRT